MIGSRNVLRYGGRKFGRILGVSERSAHLSTAQISLSPGTTHKLCCSQEVVFASSAVTMPPHSTEECPLLEKLGLFKSEHIRIKDPRRVEQLLSQIIAGGYEKLQLVVDFDYTLTRVHFKNHRYHCSWGILDNSKLMPSFYREEARNLVAKYYPIEIDPSMSEKEKLPMMIEWYNQIFDLLVKCNLSKSSIREMVANSNTRLRDGTEELFSNLDRVNVPVLIFSAGMGDVLEQVLRHFSVYKPNVRVVANFFKYNEEGVMVGFKGEMIHMFNKNENAIHSSDYFSHLSERKNVILLGDSLGDTKMAVGVPQPNNIIKIGFLNDKIEDRLQSYLDAYDIVLLDDQTMDVANSIIGQMKTEQAT